MCVCVCTHFPHKLCFKKKTDGSDFLHFGALVVWCCKIYTEITSGIWEAVNQCIFKEQNLLCCFPRQVIEEHLKMLSAQDERKDIHTKVFLTPSRPVWNLVRFCEIEKATK